MGPPDVELLRGDRGDDASLVDAVTGLVNEVYATAEAGLWRDGATRTTAGDVAGFVRAGEIVVARLDGQVVGTLRLRDVEAGTSEFGMLAAAPDRRAVGIGRALLDFAEDRARRRGMRRMRLELLVPRGWSHPTKEFLKSWYGRRGYRLRRIRRFGDAYPHMAPLLATPCDLEIHEKPLRAGS